MTPFWILWSLSCLHKVKTASWDLSFSGKWQAIAFPGGCFNLLQLFNLGYSLIFFHAFSLTRIRYLQVFPSCKRTEKKKPKPSIWQLTSIGFFLETGNVNSALLTIIVELLLEGRFGPLEIAIWKWNYFRVRWFIHRLHQYKFKRPEL